MKVFGSKRFQLFGSKRFVYDLFGNKRFVFGNKRFQLFGSKRLFDSKRSV